MSGAPLSMPDAGDDDLLAEAVEILKTRPSAPARRYLPGPDLDKMPSGYDPEVWQLALDFTQAAKHYDVEMATGKPLVYAYLFRVVEEVPKIRTKDDWTGLIKMMIKEFFENDIELEHEEYAVEQFTRRRYFKDCANWALRERAPEPVWKPAPIREPDEKELQRRAERREAAKAKEAARLKVAEQEERRQEKVNQRLREAGVDPDDVDAVWEYNRARVREANKKWGYERDGAE